MNELESFPGLGVVFNIGDLEEAYVKRARRMGRQLEPQEQRQELRYGHAAWRIFMKIIQPRQITPCMFLDGDTELTLQGGQNEFCIAVYAPNLDVEAVRQKVLAASEYGLAPFHRRLIEKIALDRQPLVDFGRIDHMGRLVTQQWTLDEHELCKQSGWPYAPERVTVHLDNQLAAELAAMRQCGRP